MIGVRTRRLIDTNSNKNDGHINIMIVRTTKKRPRSFLRRRAPDEIETALTQLDQQALHMVKQSFKRNLDLMEFAKAIVSTGTYDADRVGALGGWGGGGLQAVGEV